jgi:two-component system response regulator FixJ
MMAATVPVIAIVDDDEIVRRSIKRLVNALSFNADDFASGEEFLGSLSKGAPACMLLDLHMPGMNGLEVLEALKVRRMNIPTIIITGNTCLDTRERCINAGAVGYLEKPLEREIVLNAIQTATAIVS